MEDNTKIALTTQQKKLIAEFKELLEKMEKENIGIVGELNYFSKWEKCYLYLQLFNRQEVESLEKFCSIEEVDEENEPFIVNGKDVEKVELPIMDVINTSDSYESECYTIWFKDSERL